MPTLPPHQHRQVAESFGDDPDRYDRARPRYPEALVARIVAELPGPDVLDVGIGSGIAARQFRAAGCRVTGVEPDARMAGLARRHGFDVDVAAFEAWEPAGRTYDGVIAAQAWHWVDPEAGAAQAARVLRPGGRLALFWNVAQPEPAAAEALAAVYQRVAPDSLAARSYQAPALPAYTAIFDRVTDPIRATGAFGEPQQWQVDWEMVYTRDEWLEVMPTQGGHSQLPPATAADLLTGAGAAIDALGGSFTMRYAAVAITADRAATGW
jgi:SAM-dependent methyltransferase